MDDTPRQLGRYELVRRIAVGGMGEIYLARASGTAGFEKTVIIKTILPHLAEQEEFVEKFLDEGRIVVNLTHGNIVPVFDMDEIDGEYFIAMDYVPGRDLRDVLKQLEADGEAMPVDLAAYVISEACDGLAYAHRKTDEDGEPLNIVHRDVSPSNILISTEGEVKVIDFGIARAADRRAETVSGRIQGKCCYMSPEQAIGQSIDHRSDIFSAGVVLYEMLTGVRPFEGETDLQSLELVRQCDFDPPSAHNEAVPEEIDDIVARALAEEPEDRYQSINQLHVDLVQYLYGQGKALTSQGVAEFLNELFPEGPEREIFREARQSGPGDEDDEPVGLDEALNQELQNLKSPAASPRRNENEENSRGGREPQINPVGRTATLTSPTSEADPAEAAAEARLTDAEQGEQGRTGEASTSGQQAEEPESPAAQETGGSSDVEADASGVTGEGAEDAAQADAKPTTSSFREGPPVGTRRWIALAAVVGLLVGAGLLASYYWVGEEATVAVTSEPSGARLVLDGSELVGQTTPAELRVQPGQHELMVDAPNHQPRRFTFELEGGAREPIHAELVASEADEREEDDAPRRFEVTTEPPGARLWVNQQPVGTAPAHIEVGPGETKFVEAKAEDCERTPMPVYHGREGKTVTVRLNCERAEKERDAGEKTRAADEKQANADEAAAQGAEEPPAPPRRVMLRFVTEPAGAEVRIDGETLGTTPVDDRFGRRETLDVTLKKDGYQPMSFEVRAGSVRGNTVERTLEEVKTGCLDFFAVHPQYNEIAIDGEWLDGRRSRLKGYELPVGTHKIRVRNPNAKKDETFSVEITAGSECTSKTVWDTDDG